MGGGQAINSDSVFLTLDEIRLTPNAVEMVAPPEPAKEAAAAAGTAEVAGPDSGSREEPGLLRRRVAGGPL